MRDKDIRKECEELWAKNKYFVLSKSHKAYLEIREYLRGNGWKKKHKTVDYVFLYSPYHLFIQHVLVMEEMEKRGYNISLEWKDKNYRGRTAKKYDNLKEEIVDSPIYKEHDIEYLDDCIENLRNKGIDLKLEVLQEIQ